MLRACSTPDFPACEQRLLNVLMDEDRAFKALRGLVSPQLEVRSGRVGMFAGWRGGGVICVSSCLVQGVACCVSEEDQ